MAEWSRFCNIDATGEVKRLRQENLRLKDQIQALSKGVEQMKLLLQKNEFHTISWWTTNWRERYSESWTGVSEKRDELILFKTNAMTELKQEEERLK